MSKASDLLTVSVGRARLAWVRANKWWNASAAMQRAIDEAMAGPSPVMPRSIGRRKVRVSSIYRRATIDRPGVLVSVPPLLASEDPSVPSTGWDRIQPSIWRARVPASEIPRLAAEAAAEGRVVATVQPYVLILAVRPAVEVNRG